MTEADVVRLETGHTPSRRYAEYWDGDLPWIGILDATEPSLIDPYAASSPGET